MPRPSILVLLAALLAPQQPPAQPRGETYFVSLDGDDANAGTVDLPWRHIEWAMTRPFLRGGDTVRIRGGVYRPAGTVGPRDAVTDDALIRPVASGEPERPITVMAEPGEAVVLSGRLLASSWESVPGLAGAYYHEYAAPAGFPFDHPFQVVEEGRLLFRVANLEALERPGQCFVDASARRIYVRSSDEQSPAAHVLEYAVAISGIEFRAGVSHWRLSGFALTGFRTTGVIMAQGAGRLELDRMDISYIGAHRPGADPTSGYALATYDTSGGNQIRHSRFHHTLAETVHVSQTGAGEDLYEGNEMRDAGGPEWFHAAHSGRVLTGPGMILRGSRVTARGNRFTGNGYHGLILESDLDGAEGPASPSHNVIEHNIFASNAGNGIYADGKNGLAASTGNIIRFNLFDRNNRARAGGGDGELRLAGNFDDTAIYNNTLYAERANAVWLYGARVADGGAQGADAFPDRLKLVNNIGVYAGGARGVYPLRAAAVGPTLTADYNDWHRPAAGPLAAWNGAEFASLEEFRRGAGQERRGLSTDPRFVDAGDGHFWLRSVSPLLGQGLADVRGDGTLWAGWACGPPPDLGAFPYRVLLTATPLVLRFAALAGREPPPQTVEIRSTAEKPLRWTARADGHPWLGLSPASGEAPLALVVAAAPPGVLAGDYAAHVRIAPLLEGEPPLVVEVIFTVTPTPPRRRQQ